MGISGNRGDRGTVELQQDVEGERDQLIPDKPSQQPRYRTLATWRASIAPMCPSSYGNRILNVILPRRYSRKALTGRWLRARPICSSSVLLFALALPS